MECYPPKNNTLILGKQYFLSSFKVYHSTQSAASLISSLTRYH